MYSFIHIPPRVSRSTLVFLHGAPSQLYDWIAQIECFSAKGHGIVVPDLLGYGQSSKPSATTQYRLKPMSDEIIELLDSLNVAQAVGVGHDFGALLLSRVVAYYPDRWSALAFLAVGPPVMATPFKLDMINKMTKQALGFELLGYMAWLGRQTDASKALEEHAESAMSLIFCADHALWNKWLRPMGKLKQFVSENRRVKIGQWYGPNLQQRHLEAFAQPNGYEGMVKWYHMWIENLCMPDEIGFEDFVMRVPVLFLTEKGEHQQGDMLGAWAPDLTTKEFECGHWIHLEENQQTNEAIRQFLEAHGF